MIKGCIPAGILFLQTIGHAISIYDCELSAGAVDLQNSLCIAWLIFPPQDAIFLCSVLTNLLALAALRTRSPRAVTARLRQGVSLMCCRLKLSDNGFHSSCCAH